MNFMLCLSLLAPLKTAIAIQEPFPSPELIWAVGAAILGLWIFAVGASVGSFINVVVYRLPLGLSLSSPGSRCPRCLHPIRLQHNVPILGWLLLRGHCADCQLPISPRYPLVEFLVGSVFLLIGGVELLGNGINLPRPSPDFARTVLNTLEPQALAAATLLHLALLATLICAAIIERDERVVPRRLMLPVVLLAIVVTVIWPDVHPIIALNLIDRATLKTHWLLVSPWLDLLAGGIAGSLAGLICRLTVGRHLWFAARFSDQLFGLWIAIGLVFGWQLLTLLLFYWSLSQFAEARRKRNPVQPRPIRELLLLVLLSLLLWRLFNFPGFISDSSLGQALALGITVLAAIVLQEVATRRLPAEIFFPLPIADEAFLPTPSPSLASASDSEPSVYDSPLSSNESNEHE